MIQSSPPQRGSHFAWVSRSANSWISRIPPVCSCYIWPMFESPEETSMTTRIRSTNVPP